MGTHDGHRQRTKERVISSPLDTVDDHVLLETLLYYAIPRKDTNELAHRLLERFGSFGGVLEAEYEELRQVDGIGDSAAYLIALVTKLNKRYQDQKLTAKKTYLNNTRDFCSYFKKKFEYETRELAYAVFLDTANAIIKCEKIGSGVVNATEISVRQLVEMALKYKATSVLISHNHPGCLPFPSSDDEGNTRKIQNALDLIGIRLADHIIVGEGRSLSMFSQYVM